VDPLMLARWQFGMTTVYHFFFLVAIMETLYVRTGDETYKRMTLFWGKLFLINFAMGVVTGIVQEFQFGMNWSEYSRFVGDIFGAPLAIEALMAFFLESTFLGIWIFGWDKLSKGLHAATIWVVAIGSNLSALWILVANSFMQQPVGYAIRDGRAEMTDFFALITNSNVWVQFPHVVFAGIATAAFFVLGISAYNMVRKTRHPELFRRSFNMAVVYGTIGIVLVVLNGHSQAQHMVRVQPMKMAAAEALWESEDPAKFSLFTIGNEAERRDVFAIRIPRLLTIMAYNRLTGEVKGIKNLQAEYEQQYGPGNYVPPVAFAYWSFRMMVGSGLLMASLALYNLYLLMRGRSSPPAWLLGLLPLSIGLPYVSNATGWLLTEWGRQPWIVFGLMQTAEGISPNVPAGAVRASLLAFGLIYAVLMAADIYLLAKYARSEEIPEAEPALKEAFLGTGGAA
jgi:cytochrome bd ubiquinol oxidase subunit I